MNIRDRGSAAYQMFLLALSMYVLIALYLEMFLITDPEIKSVLQYVDFAICMVFLLDFFVNLFTAKSKKKYLKWGWIDLAASIPFVDPLRWGRLARVIRILRFLRTIKSARVLAHRIQTSKYETFTLVVVLVTFIAYTVGASLILEFERDLGGNITTADQALWWAFLNIMNAKITITEVHSQEGIFVTVVLNKVGLLLFAYVNAILIAWLIQKRIDTREMDKQFIPGD